jgi:hypothetical protein
MVFLLTLCNLSDAELDRCMQDTYSLPTTWNTPEDVKSCAPPLLADSYRPTSPTEEEAALEADSLLMKQQLSMLHPVECALVHAMRQQSTTSTESLKDVQDSINSRIKQYEYIQKTFTCKLLLPNAPLIPAEQELYTRVTNKPPTTHSAITPSNESLYRAGVCEPWAHDHKQFEWVFENVSADSYSTFAAVLEWMDAGKASRATGVSNAVLGEKKFPFFQPHSMQFAQYAMIKERGMVGSVKTDGVRHVMVFPPSGGVYTYDRTRSLRRINMGSLPTLGAIVDGEIELKFDSVDKAWCVCITLFPVELNVYGASRTEHCAYIRTLTQLEAFYTHLQDQIFKEHRTSYIPLRMTHAQYPVRVHILTKEWLPPAQLHQLVRHNLQRTADHAIVPLDYFHHPTNRMRSGFIDGVIWIHPNAQAPVPVADQIGCLAVFYAADPLVSHTRIGPPPRWPLTSSFDEAWHTRLEKDSFFGLESSILKWKRFYESDLKVVSLLKHSEYAAPPADASHLRFMLASHSGNRNQPNQYVGMGRASSHVATHIHAALMKNHQPIVTVVVREGDLFILDIRTDQVQANGLFGVIENFKRGCETWEHMFAQVGVQ